MKKQVNANSKNSNANAKVNNVKDDMEKAVAKAEKLAKIESNKAKRLAKATEQLETLKKGAKEDAGGFANITIKIAHQKRALNVSVQGAIDSLNTLIKEIAKAAELSKSIIATLKGEAAQTILQQVNATTLPLYIDNKGNYKTETLYRLVASKAKNAELRQILNNIKKQDK